MKENDYIARIQDRQRFWGVIGPWRGELGNFEFTTKAGLKAAVRRDANDGHLYGCVAVQNPEHPALKHAWNLGPAKVGAFERPVNRIPEILPPILDLPGISQGSWFVFSCGYETFGDLNPRWAHRSSLLYRDAVYVQARCEELASLLGELWNQHLATIRGTQLHDAVERSGVAVARDMEKRIGGVKQPEPAHLREYERYVQNLFKASSTFGLSRVTQSNSLPTPKPPKTGAPFLIKNFEALGTLRHEIEATSSDTAHVKVIGRNGKILVEFDITTKGAK